MTTIAFESTSYGVRTDGPACNRCASKTRLFGLEPHPTVERTDLRTWVCDACGGTQTEVVPLPR